MTGDGDGDVGQLREDLGAILPAPGRRRRALRKLAFGGRTMMSAPTAAGLVGSALDLADHDGHDGQDHDDFDGDREDADGGADRTIQDVADDELVHLNGW